MFLAEEIGESKDQIRRYIRLTELIPELLEKVDKGEIALRPAVDISYLPEDIQRSLLDTIEMGAVYSVLCADKAHENPSGRGKTHR